MKINYEQIEADIELFCSTARELYESNAAHSKKILDAMPSEIRPGISDLHQSMQQLSKMLLERLEKTAKIAIQAGEVISQSSRISEKSKDDSAGTE